jgi:HK97 family phage major capsid protein
LESNTSGAALVGGRTGDEIYDTQALRSRARNMEHLADLYRDNAKRALERATFPGSPNRERSQDTVDRLLNSVDTEDAALARRILVTGNPLYQRAWAKTMARLSIGGLSADEARALENGRALALGVAADGGYAVPYQLDPTVILTSNGAVNPLRAISRVEQIVGKEFDLVTSAGITVSRSAEASVMADNSPTLAQPAIVANRVTGFIPFSMEIEQDWQGLQSQMMMLLADAKDVEEASSFTLGNGTAPNAGGVIATMASGSLVTGTGGTATLATSDLYGLEDAMAPRFRARASWMASKTGFNAYRQLFVQDASAAGDAWVRPSAGQPPQLLGYDAWENSEMVTTHATGDKPIILGDFGTGFLIVDRIGMSTEIAPMLFDPTTGRPTGQRGLVSMWRNNSAVIVPNAFRLLEVG